MFLKKVSPTKLVFLWKVLKTISMQLLCPIHVALIWDENSFLALLAQKGQMRFSHHLASVVSLLCQLTFTKIFFPETTKPNNNKLFQKYP